MNPRFPGSFLACGVLLHADRCHNASIVFGIILGDNDGDLRFPLETVFLVVPLLGIGLELTRTTFANVLAELAAAPAHLEESLRRPRYARAPHAEVELPRQVPEAGLNVA